MDCKSFSASIPIMRARCGICCTGGLRMPRSHAEIVSGEKFKRRARAVWVNPRFLRYILKFSGKLGEEGIVFLFLILSLTRYRLAYISRTTPVRFIHICTVRISRTNRTENFLHTTGLYSYKSRSYLHRNHTK